jgi:hypothetical protein
MHAYTTNQSAISMPRRRRPEQVAFNYMQCKTWPGAVDPGKNETQCCGIKRAALNVVRGAPAVCATVAVQANGSGPVPEGSLRHADETRAPRLSRCGSHRDGRRGVAKPSTEVRLSLAAVTKRRESIDKSFNF